jgi:hypothetical protein
MGIVLICSPRLQAGHMVAVRTSGQKSTGARTDITVPYLTSGKSAFISGSVAPKIYSSPVVDDPNNPQSKPVYNLIFYGSKQSFGDRSNGATPRTP